MAQAPDICPVCGSEVPDRAKACPECGADEKTGWSEKARYDALGIPDDPEEFNYDDFVERECQGKKPQRSNARLWFVVALVLVILFAVAFLRNFQR